LRVVVKLGTKLLTKSDGILDTRNISRIAKEIGGLLDSGIEVIIVSSGAIGAGCGKLDFHPSNLTLREKQAVASVGQTELMNVYKKAFASQGRLVGQILLTSHDFTDRNQFLNIRNTFNGMLKWKIVPIVNENDTVAVQEIKFGDNDHLAAIIASKVDADKLIILTDVDGLMNKEGDLVKEVSEVTDTIMRMAGGRGSDFSVGGMISKVKAAKSVTKHCGKDTYLANGRKSGVLKEIVKGKNPGTVFRGAICGVSHKKRWIVYGLKPQGNIVVDAGAVNALMKKNSSLLPVGIKKVTGSFKSGDPVDCRDEKGKVLARGLVNYSSSDINKIMGRKSSEIEKVLGHKYYDEVIHKDNLVII
jgi:glutamate 5-kinase